jgi:hypothetical protein
MPTEPPARRRLLGTAVALAGFTLLTLALFRPGPSELAHTTPAFHGDNADALLLMWATSHVSRTLLAAPGRLFDAPIFHPLGETLAFGDHMIGEALVGLPIWLATRNPLLEYNLLSLASYALGATAMFAYAREAVGGGAPAVAAGLVFAFTPYRFHSPLWLQVLFSPFMPLALLFWLRFVRGLRWRDWALWVACWVAHSLMGMYLALYFGVTMAVLAAAALVAAPTRSPRLWRGTLLAAVAVPALLAPTLWPYVHLRVAQGQLRHAGLDTGPSFFLPGPGTLSGALAGLGGPGQFGPGLVAVGLAVVGIVGGAVAARRERSPGRFVHTMHAIGLATTLLLVLAPTRVLLAVPGFDTLRNTNRAFFVGLLFVAAFVAEGVAWAMRRVGSRRLALAAGAAAVVLLAADMGRPARERRRMPLGDEIPPVHRWLATLPAGAVVYEGEGGTRNPSLALYYSIFPMYYSIFHGKRLAQGYSGFSAPGGAYLTMQLSRFPDDEALRLAAATGVDHVVWRFGSPAVADAAVARLPRPHVDVAARFGADVVFRVRSAPPPPDVAAAVAPLPREGWTVRASLAPAALPALHDGDRRTAWRGDTLADRRSAPWLEVDLGREWPVAGVRCVPADANAPGIYLARIELSPDGARWEPVAAEFRPDSLATLLHRPGELAFYEARFATRVARAVRLVSPAIAFPGWPWEIAELDVLADCAAAPVPGCPAS